MTDPALEVLWKRVLDGWDDEATHAAFTEHCRNTGQLLEAAVRYRGMAGDHVRGAVADRHLRGVAILAMAALEQTRSERRPAGPRWLLITIAVVLLSAAAGWLRAVLR
ncbi:MAG: hypothetical protein FJ104_02370 [Deltaproteobacteria bacterium]|nr:hypothetical protein [Deltaproteobacteria bacterium]